MMLSYPAKYTVVLKSLLDNEQTKALIDNALSKYPLYPTKEITKDIIPTREELNTKLLNYYKYREIAFETVGRFIDELENTMLHIMPYYNEQYKTVDIMANLEDPFGNVDVTETFKETRKGSASSSGSSQSESEANTTSTGTSNTQTTDNSTTSATKQGTEDSTSIENDTPQGKVGLVLNNALNTDYASKVNYNKSGSSGTESATGTNTSASEGETTQTGTTTGNDSTTTATSAETADEVEHTMTKKGNQGVTTYAHDMLEYRDTIIDITNRIITDKRIAELFMLVY